MYKKLIEKHLKCRITEGLRSVKVTYDDGTVISTSMAAHLTDDEILDYFKIGKTFNIGDGPNDKMAKVANVEILDDDDYLGVNESTTPGLTNTEKVQKSSKKENDDYYKETSKKFKEYEKAAGQEDKDKIEPVKRNNSDKETEWHDDMEIRNGMEMLRYDGGVDDKFKERQEMAIAGDSKMGNEMKTGEWNPETGEGNGNTEPVWGASSPDFGKKLVDTIRRSAKKRTDATKTYQQFGDDIEKVDGKPNIANKPVGVGESNEKKDTIKEYGKPKSLMADRNYTHFAIYKPTNQIMSGWNYKGYDKEELNSEKKHYFFNDLEDWFDDFKELKKDVKIINRKKLDSEGIDPEKTESWFRPNSKSSEDNTTNIKENNLINHFKVTYDENGNIAKKEVIWLDKEYKIKGKNFDSEIRELNLGDNQAVFPAKYAKNGEPKLNKNNNPEIKESEMKRLKFKNPFNGQKNALNLIPEHYKVDNKIFEMTDGVETYKVRWEGKAPIVLEARNQNKINEEVEKMKHLFSYNSRKAMGTLKPNERLTENLTFSKGIQTKSIVEVDEDGNKVLNFVKEHHNENMSLGGQKLEMNAKEAEPGEEITGGAKAKGDATEYVVNKKGKNLAFDNAKEIDPASGVKEAYEFNGNNNVNNFQKGDVITLTTQKGIKTGSVTVEAVNGSIIVGYMPSQTSPIKVKIVQAENGTGYNVYEIDGTLLRNNVELSVNGVKEAYELHDDNSDVTEGIFDNIFKKKVNPDEQMAELILNGLLNDTINNFNYIKKSSYDDVYIATFEVDNHNIKIILPDEMEPSIMVDDKRLELNPSRKGGNLKIKIANALMAYIKSSTSGVKEAYELHDDEGNVASSLPDEVYMDVEEGFFGGNNIEKEAKKEKELIANVMNRINSNPHLKRTFINLQEKGDTKKMQAFINFFKENWYKKIVAPVWDEASGTYINKTNMMSPNA